MTHLSIPEPFTQHESVVIVADLLNPAHAEATIHLLNHYSKDEMGGGQALPAFVQDNLIAELLRRKEAHVLLAYSGQTPVGLAIMMLGFSTFACMPLLNIHDVVVLNGYRGQGIAQKLLFKAEEIAQSLGCCKLTLEVLEGNKAAQSAYKLSGFAGYELNPQMGKALFWQKKLISNDGASAPVLTSTPIQAE
ncbi:MAG: GNAT family N-acetyltransferase [Aquabacterium sp.]|nr:GNAT family N-acetyltransferase [Aquabacterium sp.]